MFTDVHLPPLMPDEDNNFGGSLVLDFSENDGVTCSPRSGQTSFIIFAITCDNF